jgi:hypothetical protein
LGYISSMEEAFEFGECGDIYDLKGSYPLDLYS